MESNILEIATILFILMDPFGNMVLINNLLSDYERRIRRRIILRESLIALVLLATMSLVGTIILDFLGLKESSIRIAGGIVLFLISLRMVFPGLTSSHSDMENFTDPFIVPIAVPLIAGPSALSMVSLYSHTYPITIVLWAVLLSCGFSLLILLFSPTLFRWLGDRGSRAIERLMGMLLIMVSVQMVLDGVKQFLE